MTHEDLLPTLRTALAGAGTVREVKMFGGTGFMLNGNMVAAVSKRGLLLRVGKDRQSQALAESGVRPMVMRGRTMRDYVYVDPVALNREMVRKWVPLAAAFVQSLPSKPTAANPERSKVKRK
jgi:TfoX/Sxy family transcriptional regulator of competence genes